MKASPEIVCIHTNVWVQLNTYILEQALFYIMHIFDLHLSPYFLILLTLPDVYEIYERVCLVNDRFSCKYIVMKDIFKYKSKYLYIQK